MARRDPTSKRAALEWAVRGALALVLVAIGSIAVTFSMAQTGAQKDLVLAHRLAPYDAHISARLASWLFVNSKDAATRATASQLAQEALRWEPTAVAAVTTLGFQAQFRDDPAQSRQFFGYAQMLSRRDLATQLWAIEDAVGRGDVTDAVRHYDIALRTSRNAPDVLFPVLATAIDDPIVRARVLSALRTQPIWTLNFITFASVNSAPRTAAILFENLTRARVPVPSTATAAVINRLISANAVDDAWRYYSAIRTGVDRRRARDPRFDAELPTPSVFDWQWINDEGISTSIQHGGTGNVFDFSVAPSTGGILIQQLQMLPAGSYNLSGHSIGIEQSTDALPYWTLTCGDGRELGRVVVPNSASAGGVFSGHVDVPSSCPVQKLTLVARPSDRISGLGGQIDRVSLEPVR